MRDVVRKASWEWMNKSGANQNFELCNMVIDRREVSTATLYARKIQGFDYTRPKNEKFLGGFD